MYSQKIEKQNNLPLTKFSTWFKNVITVLVTTIQTLFGIGSGCEMTFYKFYRNKIARKME